MNFTVIPVIDIRNGVAVRAVAGDRANYQPLISPLCSSPDPNAVADGLMALHPFPVLYVADLDGIEGRGANLGLIAELAGTLDRRVSHEGSTRTAAAALWVDNGARTETEVAALLAMPRTSAVIGSETGITPAALRELIAHHGDRLILSLDFRKTGFVGDPALLADRACWPARVIVMTLARIGGNRGPDLAQVGLIKHRHTGGQIFAAGGVRNGGDLRAAAHCGTSGALVSSALHAQTITAADLGGSAAVITDK